jgi:hypothetical protein
MTAQHDGHTQAALDRLLKEHSLGYDTRLYREAMRESLTPTGEPGVYRLSANASPSESVVDVYGNGYVMQAETVGPGLAFAESAAPNWQETMEMRAMRAGRAKLGVPSADKVEVEIRLEDILRQGGLIYPVESVSVERVWYCTLPTESVDVREVS